LCRRWDQQVVLGWEHLRLGQNRLLILTPLMAQNRLLISTPLMAQHWLHPVRRNSELTALLRHWVQMKA
jgi:hypothetical protein